MERNYANELVIDITAGSMPNLATAERALAERDRLRAENEALRAQLLKVSAHEDGFILRHANGTREQDRLRAINAELVQSIDTARALFKSIAILASCAPNDDEEKASQEFTKIMEAARRGAALLKSGGAA